MKLLFMTFCLLTIFIKINGESFSATTKLENLLETQTFLIETFDNLLKNKKSRNKIVKSYVELLKKEQQEAMNDSARYLGNPINGFRLIKRLSSDLELVEDILDKIADYRRNNTLKYPKKKDLTGAAEGILRLQTTYELNNKDLANGFWNVSFGETGKTYVQNFSPMSVSDCYELGKALYSLKLYPPGIEWLKQASRKFLENDKTPDVSRLTLEDIQLQISNGYRHTEVAFKDFVHWFKKLALLSPDLDQHINKVDRDKIVTCFRKGLTPEQALKVIKFEEHLAVSYNPRDKIKLSINELNETYTALCRGISTSRMSSRRLSCYYARGPHPFLILAPIKAERLHIAPNFTLFYDVISDAEIQAVITFTKPKLVRVQFSAGYITETSTERISQTTFVSSNESIAVARVRTRVSQFTGMDLTTNSSEPLQVMNYGIGGFHKLHYDYSTLSDVEQGGAAVFPALGLAVFPVKGAALVWTNLLHTGEGDPYVFRAACPVLLGHKWVATQWINMYGQELRQPCLVNYKRRKYPV